MKRFWSDKRWYFAGFGALGGLLSAFFYAALELDGPFSSWVIGTGFDGLCIAGLLAFGQARYLGKPFDAKAFGKALLIGGVGGAIGGQVILYDRVANTRRNLAVDEAFEISNARVVVRSKRVSGTTS